MKVTKIDDGKTHLKINGLLVLSKQSLGIKMYFSQSN